MAEFQKKKSSKKWSMLATGTLWSIVLVNLLPILWMVWCSFMGSGEILDGKLFPRPRANDVVYAAPVGDSFMVVGSSDGQLSRISRNSFLMPELKHKSLGTFATSYEKTKNELWSFSSTRGLLRIDPITLQETQELSLAEIADRYKEYEQTQFHFLPEHRIPGALLSLAKKLNETHLSKISSETFSSFVGVHFKADSTIIEELNQFLNDDQKVASFVKKYLSSRRFARGKIRRMATSEFTPKRNRILFRMMLAEMVPTPLLYLEETHWEDLWVTRIPSTTLVHRGSKLFFAVWWNGFPGIGIYNTSNKSLHWVTPVSGLPSRSIQHLLMLKSGKVLALSDEGVSLIDPNREIVTNNYLFGMNGLRYADGRRVQVAEYGDHACILSFSEDLMYLDFDKGKAWPLKQGFLRRISSEITALTVQNQLLFAGTGQGIFSLDLSSLENEEHTSLQLDSNSKEISLAGLEMKLYGGIFVERKPSEIASVDRVIDFIHASGQDILVGSLAGSFSVLSLKNRRVKGFHNFETGPSYFHWRNYVDLWKTIPFGKFLWNSFVICFSVMLLTMLIASLGAYGISRYQFPGRELFGQSVLVTQMVPAVLFLIPIFIFFTSIKRIFSIPMVNTYPGIILTYTAFFTPMAIWFLRGFFAKIPKELEESALIDGCNSFTAFIRVIVPATISGIFATGIFIFLLAWDELLFAWVLCTDSATATIPVGIRLYVGQLGNRFDLLMAASTVSSIPVMILFVLMQKNILAGLTRGTIKS